MRTNNGVFLDTNILLTGCDRKRANHQAAFELMSLAVEGSLECYISVQVLNEFARNAMNPDRNINPLTNVQVKQYLSNIYESKIIILPLTLNIHKNLLKLNDKYKLYGAKLFDLLIFATMLENGIYKIVTENIKDFKNFEGIEILKFNDLI